ncbi:hypothetical protein BJX61DRAFT_296322 [Aspergillus egyptiacus]|nr:hypothetical protein BJX61DRAFT_296322 [Aspergillus egyptiacus]
MSNPRERPWTEEERYALYTEILKKARVPSHFLYKLINDMNITPSWGDILLPPGTGRSLNSCQSAFHDIGRRHGQETQTQVNPGLAPSLSLRHGPPPPSLAPLDPTSSVRKRLYPADKPPPVPLQPRPPASTASYSSESGASAILSPGIGPVTGRDEPPRKRGRPSKAESERRKAAAEARGETYPPLRRSNSHKLKAPSTPTSPSGIEARGMAFPTQSGNRPLLPNVSQPEMRYVPPPLRPMSMPGSSEGERVREFCSREIGPASRELPRPTDVRQTLPSPQELQLGHRETVPRIEPSDRPYEILQPDRLPLPDSSRRNLVHPAPRPLAQSLTPDNQISLTTTAEKRPE